MGRLYKASWSTICILHESNCGSCYLDMTGICARAALRYPGSRVVEWMRRSIFWRFERASNAGRTVSFSHVAADAHSCKSMQLAV